MDDEKYLQNIRKQGRFTKTRWPNQRLELE